MPQKLMENPHFEIVELIVELKRSSDLSLTQITGVWAAQMGLHRFYHLCFAIRIINYNAQDLAKSIRIVSIRELCAFKSRSGV